MEWIGLKLMEPTGNSLSSPEVNEGGARTCRLAKESQVWESGGRGCQGRA